MQDQVSKAQSSGKTRSKAELKIAIIGSGFAGIGMAISLKQAGYRAMTIFEKGSALGGTWRDNIYPGAECDVPSHLYSYSFAPNPDWSHRFSPQPEILAYLAKVATDHGIVPLIRSHTPIKAARFDERHQEWVLEHADGETERFDILIPAVGQLSRPIVPAIAGAENFSGDAFHSAQWNPKINLAGKRVAVIGSAASAVQIIPRLAEQAAAVTVYQRTPNWIIPRWNYAYSAVARLAFRHVPGVRRALRVYLYWKHELLFRALKPRSFGNSLVKLMASFHLNRQVRDPALRARLTPDYPPGCKRLLVSDEYLKTFNLPHVDLVTDRISRIERDGVRSEGGDLRAADVIVYATGFDASNCLTPITITGVGGQDLQAVWQDGPEAYLGMAVAGFPNLFLLYGPNTNLGHSSIILMLECQFNYIVNCLNHLIDQEKIALDVDPIVQRRYNDALQKALSGSIWAAGCTGWYTTGTKITANWPGSCYRYLTMTRTVDFSAFRVQGDAKMKNQDVERVPVVLSGGDD